MGEPHHIVAVLRLLACVAQGGGHAGQQGGQVVAAAGAVQRKVGGPGVDGALANAVPIVALLGAKIHLAQARIGMNGQIGL